MIPRALLKRIRRIELRLNQAGGWFLGLALLSLTACSTTPPNQPALPSPTSFNLGAGCGHVLFLNLRMEDGEERLFCVDTGGALTVLDKSLEAKLGKSVGHKKINLAWVENGKWKAKKYKSPKLYLGATQLQLGEHVYTGDITRLLDHGARGRPLAGILGMDCLQNYCIQLDFNSRTVRFLNPDELKPELLGAAFPLAYTRTRFPFILSSSTSQFGFPLGFLWGNLTTELDFYGQRERFIVDTGDFSDGTLKPATMERVLKAQAHPATVQISTNTLPTRRDYVHTLPEYYVGGKRYTNVTLASADTGPAGKPLGGGNAIGLRFLARHRVTFDFPGRTMYLKPTDAGPIRMITDEENVSFHEFIKEQKKNGSLPGLAKDLKGALYAESRLEPWTYSFHPADSQVEGSPTRYYRFQRTHGEDKSWVLRRAWRMDQVGNTIEDYPIP
jgi:hypothetical protein